MSLPLPGEIVTADVSRCDNEGAGEFASGGWVGNEEHEQSRTRAVGRMVISTVGKQEGTMIMGVYRPSALELWPGASPVTS